MELNGEFINPGCDFIRYPGILRSGRQAVESTVSVQ
jgi:hypothetical protein